MRPSARSPGDPDHLANVPLNRNATTAGTTSIVKTRSTPPPHRHRHGYTERDIDGSPRPNAPALTLGISGWKEILRNCLRSAKWSRPSATYAAPFLTIVGHVIQMIDPSSTSCSASRLAAPYPHENGRGRRGDVHDADDRFVGNPALAARPRQREQRGADAGEYQGEDERRPRVGGDAVEQRDDASQARHLRERQIHENDFARDDVQAEVGVDGDEHHARTNGANMNCSTVWTPPWCVSGR